MKEEKGLGVVGIIVIIFVIILITVGAFFMVKKIRNDLDDSKIKSSMLLIQGACKIIYEDGLMNKTEEGFVGVKLSEADNNESINKDIINQFKEKNIIEESEYEKYYILTDEDLDKLEIYVRNEEDSYYVIGYEKEDVIITKGYNGKYRLEDINKEDDDVVVVDDENKDTEEQDNLGEETSEEASEENVNNNDENEESGENEEE